MFRLTIRYDNEEELCQLLQKTLQKLPSCENLPVGQGLAAALNATSRGLPSVSTVVQDERLDDLPAPRSTPPTRILGRPGDFEDPLFLQAVEDTQRQFRALRGTGTSRVDVDTIEDPFFGPNVFQNEVTVQDAKGKITRQRTIPIDLDLLGALEAEGDSSIFSSAVIGASRGLASLLGLGNTTVSEALARASGGDTKNVHVALGLPVIGVIPGDALRDTLLRESDQSLLMGDIESLRRSVEVGKLFDTDDNAKTKAVIERNAGNLEILRIQAQEEF